MIVVPAAVDVLHDALTSGLADWTGW